MTNNSDTAVQAFPALMAKRAREKEKRDGETCNAVIVIALLSIFISFVLPMWGKITLGLVVVVWAWYTTRGIPWKAFAYMPDDDEYLRSLRK